MKSVGDVGMAAHEAVNFGVARERPLRVLQHNDAGSFAGHDAFSIHVERAARLQRIRLQAGHPVALSRDRRHLAAHAITSAGDRHVDHSALDHTRRQADRVERRGAGGANRQKRPVQAVVQRDLARRHVRPGLNLELARHSRGALGVESVLGIGQGLDPCHGGPDDDGRD